MIQSKLNDVLLDAYKTFSCDNLTRDGNLYTFWKNGYAVWLLNHNTLVEMINNGETNFYSPRKKIKCKHDEIKLTGKFETENLECSCGFKIPF